MGKTNKREANKQVRTPSDTVAERAEKAKLERRQLKSGKRSEDLTMGMTLREYLLWERDQRATPQKRQNLWEQKQNKRNVKHGIRSGDELFKRLVEQDNKKRGVDTLKRSDGISSEEMELFRQLMALGTEKRGVDTTKRADGISSEEMELYRQLMALGTEKRGVDTTKRSDGIS